MKGQIGIPLEFSPIKINIYVKTRNSSNMVNLADQRSREGHLMTLENMPPFLQHTTPIISEIKIYGVHRKKI